MKRQCADCEFWVSHTEGQGACYVDPPSTTIVMSAGLDQQPRPVNLSHRPETKADDGCARWIARRQNPVIQ